MPEAAGQVEHGPAADRQVAGHLDGRDVARLAEAREEVREDVAGDLLGGARVAELHPVLGGQRLDVGQHLRDLAATGLAGQARPRAARERQAQAPVPREAERHGRRERQHLDQRVEPAVGLQHRHERVVVGALDLGAPGDVVLHVDLPAPQDRDRVEHGVGVAVAAQDPEPPAGQGLGGAGGERRGARQSGQRSGHRPRSAAVAVSSGSSREFVIGPPGGASQQPRRSARDRTSRSRTGDPPGPSSISTADVLAPCRGVGRGGTVGRITAVTSRRGEDTWPTPRRCGNCSVTTPLRTGASGVTTTRSGR